MKDYKMYTFEEIVDEICLGKKAQENVQKRLDAGMSKVDAVRVEIFWPEGFLESLKGKTLEEQMESYRIIQTCCRESTAYGKITAENKNTFGCSLDEYCGLKGLVVENGILLGVRIHSAWDHTGLGKVVFPYWEVCTYYACDNNGAGYKEREDYAHLCCIASEAE